MKIEDRRWLDGYIAETRYIHSLGAVGKNGRFVKGWAGALSSTKKTIRYWARPFSYMATTEQTGMIDAILDSVGY